MTNKINNFVKSTALALPLLMPNLAQAKGSVETLVTDEVISMDAKQTYPVAPRTNVFLRAITFVDGKEKPSYFGLADLNVDIFGGLDATLEAQFIPGLEISPRLGLGYFTPLGQDAWIYSLVTTNKNASDLELVANLGYTPKDSNLRAGAKNFTRMSNEFGHEVSAQKLRAGYNINGVELGVGVDIKEIKDQKTQVVPGLYVKLSN